MAHLAACLLALPCRFPSEFPAPFSFHACRYLSSELRTLHRTGVQARKCVFKLRIACNQELICCCFRGLNSFSTLGPRPKINERCGNPPTSNEFEEQPLLREGTRWGRKRLQRRSQDPKKRSDVGGSWAQKPGESNLVAVEDAMCLFPYPPSHLLTTGN